MLHPCCAPAVNQWVRRPESSGERAVLVSASALLPALHRWEWSIGAFPSSAHSLLSHSTKYLLEIGYAVWLARRICLLRFFFFFSFLPRIAFRFVLSYFYLFYPHCSMCLQLRAKVHRAGTEAVTTAHVSPAQQWYQMNLCRLLPACPGLGSSLAVLLLHRGEGCFYLLCAFSLEAWTRVDDEHFSPHFWFLP